MATKEVVVYIDDFTGDVIKAGQNRSIAFAVEGVEYEIDVTAARAKKFHDFLAPFMVNARRVGGARQSRATQPARRDALQTKAIRAWAADHGYPINRRGRIPAEIESAYHGAH
jgi:hypothetical protein